MPDPSPLPGSTPPASPPHDVTAAGMDDSTSRVGDPPPSAVPFLSPPEKPDEIGRLGTYRVLKLLGEGGMGFVYHAEDTVLRRAVALKVMRPEVAAKATAKERFLREGRAAAALNNDHIVTIYQVAEANGVPYMALEFLEGATLDDWLKKHPGPQPLSVLLKVARDVLKGLAVAHDKGLVHRDIKPANLWVQTETQRVKLLDFGLTRDAGGQDQVTQEGAVVGTPAYMAPEQAGGKAVGRRPAAVRDRVREGTTDDHQGAGEGPEPAPARARAGREAVACNRRRQPPFVNRWLVPDERAAGVPVRLLPHSHGAVRLIPGREPNFLA
jgi:serine/threonine protein kinase